MNLFRKSGLLPHEWFFGIFLVAMTLRLCFTADLTDVDAVLFSGVLFVNVAVIAWCNRCNTKGRWLLRLWMYPVMMNVIFMNMKSSVMKVNSHKWDETLAACDRWLFGEILSVRTQSMISPWITEVLSFCYLLFFPYLMISWFYYAYRGMPVLRKLFVGLFTIYGIGFLGYTLVPAGGPHLAYPEEFSVPLGGWAIARFNAFVVANGSNGVDVFPSLHSAVSLFLLMFDCQNARWRFRVYLVPCVGIWLATIYLRYHYAIDLLAGFALAGFALWITRKWEVSNNILSTTENSESCH
ncbi:MAG: phosphatase PAP2 family protein [Verrucomicrobiota bacterium]